MKNVHDIWLVSFPYRAVVDWVPFLCGPLAMGGEAMTVAVVMATQIVFTLCQSAQQQNMELLHGILSTVHQL